MVKLSDVISNVIIGIFLAFYMWHLYEDREFFTRTTHIYSTTDKHGCLVHYACAIKERTEDGELSECRPVARTCDKENMPKQYADVEVTIERSCPDDGTRAPPPKVTARVARENEDFIANR